MGCGRRVTGLVLALLACAACSSSSGGANVAAFVGTWQYSGATQTETCGTASTTKALTTTIQIQQGTASGTIEYIGANGCSFALDVSGDRLLSGAWSPHAPGVMRVPGVTDSAAQRRVCAESFRYAEGLRGVFSLCGGLWGQEHTQLSTGRKSTTLFVAYVRLRFAVCGNRHWSGWPLSTRLRGSRHG